MKRTRGNTVGKKRGPGRPFVAPEDRTLTSKQQRFVNEYLIDLAVTKAAIRAGYAKGGAHVTGSNLLKLPHVQAAVQAGLKKQQYRTEITADRTLRECARVAFFNPKKMFDEAGKLIPIHMLDDETAACIGGIDVYQKYVGQGEESCREAVKKFKIWDKNSALEKLFRRFKNELEPESADDVGPEAKEIEFVVIDGKSRKKTSTD